MELFENESETRAVSVGRRRFLRAAQATAISAFLPACSFTGAGIPAASTIAPPDSHALEAFQPPQIVSYGDISRLAQVMTKVKSRNPIKICGLGGSITAGANATTVDKRWLNLVAGWLEIEYDCPVSIWNAGISGTASDYGALRLQRDVLAHSPDIVFVEYAVNDSATDGPSYDSVIRNLLAATPQIAVVPIMFCTTRCRAAKAR
ncbi:hypothetical protein A9R05_05595 [Burkholderia sp. KK1]|nr:hypothetical protein A9R05_05595 [Burkholderia sp. KK1]